MLQDSLEWGGYLSTIHFSKQILNYLLRMKIVNESLLHAKMIYIYL